MKILDNKKIDSKQFVNSNKDKDVRYADLIRLAVNYSAQGFTISEIRERSKIMDIIEAGGESFVFDKDQARKLKQLVEQAKWPIMSAELVAFFDDITEMRDYDSK